MGGTGGLEVRLMPSRVGGVDAVSEEFRCFRKLGCARLPDEERVAVDPVEMEDSVEEIFGDWPRVGRDCADCISEVLTAIPPDMGMAMPAGTFGTTEVVGRSTFG